ncbi:MAG: poly(3-hydroxybutyrate) depolymerase [Acidimicrobiales bacterium]|nr:poly(3-hydroxybutyrate) depolymerase [Acidimicrobiales bacterium]
MRRTLVVLVLLLAGCSGSNEQTANPTTSTAVPVTASAGCQAAPIPPGEQRVTTTSGGQERWYLRHAVQTTKPLPLVVDLHGYSEGAEIHAKLSDLGADGDRWGFHTITPQGTGDPVRWDTAFDSADVRFIGDLLDEAEDALCVDTNRVYVTGLSNGAFMTSTIGCVYADRVAAIAPVAGIRNPEGCKPSRPVPVLAIHGTADTFVGYDGGLGEGALDLPAPDGSGRTLRDIGAANQAKGPSIPETTAAWAKRDGCGSTPKESKVSVDVDRFRYPCPAGREVALYRVNGGGHSWPGSPFGPAIEKVVGKTTDTIEANRVVFDFFRRHPLR